MEWLPLLIPVLLIYLGYERSLRLQTENQRSHIRVEIYDKVADALEDWGTHLGAAASVVRGVVMDARMRLQGLFVVSTRTTEEVLGAHNEAAKATSRVLLFLERYEIIFLRFHQARRDISGAHGELLEAFVALMQSVHLLVPSRRGAKPFSDIDPERFAELEERADRYLHVCSDLQGYLLDLGVEAQNELLAPLFRRTVPPRNPGDPNVKVLTRSAGFLTERPPGRW